MNIFIIFTSLLFAMPAKINIDNFQINKQVNKYLKIRQMLGEAEKSSLKKRADAWFDNHPKGKFDIERNDIDLLIDPETADLIVTSTITVNILKDNVSELNFAIPSFKVTSAIDGAGANLDYKVTNGAVLVTLKQTLNTGDKIIVVIASYGTLQCSQQMLWGCGFDGKIKFIAFQNYFPHTPYQIDPFVSNITVTVPSKWIVASSAEFKTLEAGSNDTSVFSFEYSVPTDNIGLGMADYVRGETDDAGFPIGYYHLKKHNGVENDILDLGKDIILYYESIYSVFPWNKLDIIEVDNKLGGGFSPLEGVMIIQSIFGMPLDSPFSFTLKQLVSHEIAHQWWGNLVGIFSPDSILLSEGLAEFSSSLYSDTYMKKREHITVNGMTYLLDVPEDQDRALTDFYVYNSQYYFQIMYDKGSFVLDMLRFELGDEVFFKGMKKYIADFNHKYANINDFIDIFNSISPNDISWFWDSWLNQKGYPHIKIIPTYQNKQLEIKLVEQDERQYDMTFPITVLYSDGTEQVIADFIDNKSKIVDIALSDNKEIQAIIPDKNRHILRKIEPKKQLDINFDNEVNGLDFLMFAENYGRSIFQGNGYSYPDPQYTEYSDFNKDGRIDKQDLALFKELF